MVLFFHGKGREMQNSILSFIEQFKEKGREEIEDTFLNGQCYWFAYILVSRFGGTIWFNPTIPHFCAKIDRHLYDITGLKENGEYWYEWETYKKIMTQECKSLQLKDIIQSCILKVQ